MRVLLTAMLMLAGVLSAKAEEPLFSQDLKVSLVFHEHYDPASRYPHLLQVFLRLDNTHDSGVSWVADSAEGIKAELLDSANQPAKHPPSVASVTSSSSAYFLPFGSRLDWLISHGGISMMADAKDSYALMVGCRGWLIPIHAAGSYTLHVQLYGFPGRRSTAHTDKQPPQLLLDLAPARLEVTP